MKPLTENAVLVIRSLVVDGFRHVKGIFEKEKEFPKPEGHNQVCLISIRDWYERAWKTLERVNCADVSSFNDLDFAWEVYYRANDGMTFRNNMIYKAENCGPLELYERLCRDYVRSERYLRRLRYHIYFHEGVFERW